MSVHLLIGLIPADNPWGKSYQKKKKSDILFINHCPPLTIENISKEPMR